VVTGGETAIVVERAATRARIAGRAAWWPAVFASCGRGELFAVSDDGKLVRCRQPPPRSGGATRAGRGASMRSDATVVVRVGTGRAALVAIARATGKLTGGRRHPRGWPRRRSDRA